MKKNFIILFFIMTVILFGGCEKDYTKGIEQHDTSSTMAENPFTNADGNVIVPGEVLSNFGFWVGKDKKITYDNNLLQIPLTIQNNGSNLKLGIMVFVNGILQEYYSDDFDNMETMHSFKVDSNSIENFELYVKNIDTTENGEENTISFLVITNPQNNPTPQNFQSNFHSNIGSNPEKINMNSIINISSIKIQNCTDIHTITDEEAEKLYIDRNVNKKIKTLSTTNFMLAPSDINEPLTGAFEVNNNKVSAKICGYSINDSEAIFRISIYKNHKKTTFNNGYDYIDMQTRNGQLSVANIEIDNLKSGDFIYGIAVPINTVDKWVYKTDTIMILNAEEMPDVSEGGSFKLGVPSEINHDFDEEDDENDDIEFYTGEDYDELPISTDWTPIDQDEIESLKSDKN